jgi:hypothetical protein
MIKADIHILQSRKNETSIWKTRTLTFVIVTSLLISGNHTFADTVTKDATKTSAATFPFAPKAVIGSTGYTSFAKAYTAASGSPTTVMMLEGVLPIDTVVITKPLILMGGYLPDFSRSTSGYTTLNGKLTIRSGSLVADRIAVAPSMSTATLTSIAVTPTNISLSGGANQQFSATGTYSDNSTIDLISSIIWKVLEVDGGSISNEGMYTAPATPGTYHITAQRCPVRFLHGASYALTA